MAEPTPDVMAQAIEALEQRLRDAAPGREEWRVQHPVERCYCMVFSREEFSVNPEMDAREWLADFAERHPNHPHAKYEVAKVLVFSQLEQAAHDAADQLAALRALQSTPTNGEEQQEAQDAKRYRWLRNGDWEPLCSNWLIKMDLYGQRAPDLDAAIDSAIAQQGEKR